MITPDFETFKGLTKQGNLIPVHREVLADLDTPLSAFLKTAGDSPYSFLFESVYGGEKWGRYSILGADPGTLFIAHRDRVEIQRAGLPPDILPTRAPLELLKQHMARFKPVAVAGLPRFHGGAVGYLGYDVVRCFERIPDANPDTLNLPEAVFLFCDTVLIFDNLLGKMKIVANVFVEEGDDVDAAYRQARDRIDETVARLRRPLPPPPPHPCKKRVEESDFTPQMPRDRFEAAVSRAKEYILAGDIMQVVLSQRLSIPFGAPPLDLYRALRTTNPSPYLFLLRLGEFALVGSSPEILVRLEEGQVTVRPIAGTRPRGANEEEDLALEEDLLQDPKERAEHIMLVDLGRNDVGRVAVTGSVRVTERFSVERYSHVMHIVSNVEGTLQEGLDAFDVLAATFPAGTVSGAPKIRAMEIIDELEVSRRGPYAGAVGYFSYSGNMDLAIAIRTAVIRAGELTIQAGAGIVADSDPEREWLETMNKARAVFRAVDRVQRGLE